MAAVDNHSDFRAQKRKSVTTISPSNWQEVMGLDETSLVAQRLKHLPAMRETRVRSLGQEDLLEKEMENPGDDGAWWAAVYGVAQSRTRLKRLSIA